MTDYVDFETESVTETQRHRFDVIIVGGGAAGLTLVRELAGHNIKIAVLESGGLEETPQTEALNMVEVSGSLEKTSLQEARSRQNGPQLKVWKANIQKFGVRCRVLGGSTAGWAGKVAPFDPIDYMERDWIANSGWPLCEEDLRPYLKRAAHHLDLGPLVQGDGFWAATPRAAPEEFAALRRFLPFFWQFARSRHSLTDVMRFGPDFRSETHRGVTVFLNATAACVQTADGRAKGVEIISSLTGRHRGVIEADQVILAAGAIENARLLLLSPTAAHGPVGAYLMDHPSIEIGDFSPEHRDRAAVLLGFYPLYEHYRVYMYSCGVALTPQLQVIERLPNMAAFLGVTIAEDDPLKALTRLLRRRSASPLSDLRTVLRNTSLIVTALGRKVLNYRKIPEKLRRFLADAVVFLDANFVAREYVGGGKGRSLTSVTLNVISEQPPQASNHISLSEKTDRLGLPLPHVVWEIPQTLRRDILRFAIFLQEDLKRAGIEGFRLSPALARGDVSSLPIHDMAHMAGTTRMGTDPTTSVVDPSLAVHGLAGLHVVGASVFPTSGHANPTLMIMALAVRLADKLREDIVTKKLETLSSAHKTDETRPLVVVTGATGNLGHAVVARLLDGGYRVRGQFRNTVPDDPRIEWVQLDLARTDLTDNDFDSLVRGACAVINLAASLSNVKEMPTANVTNLARLAEASVRQGVRYLGQASSMVVYGSPKTRLVTEKAPRIDLNRPIEKQYFAEFYMREYAKSKIQGEDVLTRYRDRLHVDLYRIAVAQKEAYLADALNWGRARRLFALYRNSHFIESGTVARAIVYLMEKALREGDPGVEIYNIADSRSPTFSDIWRKAGRSPGLTIPVLFDVLKGIRTGRTLSPRYPMGVFRLDDRKLRATGFDLDGAKNQSS